MPQISRIGGYFASRYGVDDKPSDKPKQFTLSGTVTVWTCSATSGSHHNPSVGATILAVPAAASGDSAAQATTGAKGLYRIRLEEGSYHVSLRARSARPTSRSVKLTRNVGRIDFHTCLPSGSGTSSLPSPPTSSLPSPPEAPAARPVSPPPVARPPG